MGQYEYLAHHGIKGQKWGVRRYQNADGSLTPEGIKRYRRKFKKIFEQAEKVYYTKEDGDLSGWNNAVRKMKKHGLSDRAVEDVAGAYLGGSLGEVLKSANAGIEKSAKRLDSIKDLARNEGLLDDTDSLTSSGKSFMDRMVQANYYATLPLQKTAMAMAQPMISRWPSDVKNEYLDAYNRSLEYAKQGRAAESSVWASRADAIATRQQLQSFYGANVDRILETKYESLR